MGTGLRWAWDCNGDGIEIGIIVGVGLELGSQWDWDCTEDRIGIGITVGLGL